MSGGDTLRKICEAINLHDLDAFAQQWVPDVVVHTPISLGPLKGRKAVREDMEMFMRAFPDLEGELVEVLELDDRAAVRWTFRGTNTGPLPGPQNSIAPTNRRIELPTAEFHRYNSQWQVLEDYRYFDVAGLMVQLGLVSG